VFQEPQEYAFETRAELDAFLLGVTEAEGWLDSEHINPNPDNLSWPPICPTCGSGCLELDEATKMYNCEGCGDEFTNPKPLDWSLD
jgi:hypothetical protein